VRTSDGRQATHACTALPARSRGTTRQPHGAKLIALLQTFAEQAVIAISGAETYRALQERIQALGRRNSEYGERIEQQAATIDVLKAMSTSPGDPQPVFDLMVRRSTELCSVPAASLLEHDCELVHGRSYYNIER
jgi:GAF domain-containing protein